ncbi:MAG: BON domain-containing protein [Alphaproteobacteria bacterium]|nr:BON domain-containing protein [Alphaproteobacteria bacterium]
MARLASTLALIATFPLISGCMVAAVGAAGTAAVSASQERTFGEAIDDASVSTEVKSKLLSHGGMGEVDVEVAGGLVLLSGRVSTPELRVKAESLAWSAKRTRDVANEIQIEAPGGFFANASDEFISAKVRARLLGSSSVQARNINVETYGGVVYLMGIVRDQEELEKAAEEASYASGVKQVVSYMRLRDARGEIVAYRPGVPADYNPNELAGGPGG